MMSVPSTMPAEPAEESVTPPAELPPEETLSVARGLKAMPPEEPVVRKPIRPPWAKPADAGVPCNPRAEMAPEAEIVVAAENWRMPAYE